MARFTPEFLDELRARIRVSDVVGRSIKLQKRGNAYWGLSPFKKEKTPSFSVDDNRQSYHCFSTGQHGDIIKFLTETKGLTFPEAVEQLAQEAALQIIPPVFYPRLRISLIESKIEKVVSKFKIDITEIFELREEWLQQKIQRQADTQFNKLFQDSGSIIKNEMIKLQESLSRLDPTLDGSAQKTAANMLELLDKLRQKTDEAYLRKMNSDLSQLNKVLINLFPGGNFQERTVNILQYIIKYGPEFIKKLYDSVDIHDRNHQLIFLS